MKLTNKYLCMALIAILALTSANVPKTTTVFIIGDSTAANKKID